MRRSWVTVFLSLSAATITCGCGSRSGEAHNSAPLANAGPDQAVLKGKVVALDGSGSSDADGDALTYGWSMTSKPAGSAAALSSATAVAPTFTPDLAGTYELSLMVHDGTAYSVADGVTITATNVAPVANAGPDQAVSKGKVVALDGSGSSDADGDALTYGWSMTSKPAGSAAALSSATAVAPTFTPDLAGTYELSLMVHDGTAYSVADGVTITATNVAPVASAGPDQAVLKGKVVTLDGGGSSDADGDALTYGWSMTSKPAGSAAALSSATAVAPTFTPDLAGTYELSLMVHDGAAYSVADGVTIAATEPVVTDDVVGGSRLSARWLGGPDGGAIPNGFHDLERGEDCGFAIAGDGQWRCLPSGGPLDGGSVFSDATCTVQLYADFSGCSPPTFLRRTDSAACPDRTRLFELGLEVPASDPLYALDAYGACKPWSSSSARIFAVGAEVDYSLFAHATPSRGLVIGSLAEEFLAGDDGSRQFTALWDQAAGRACRPRIASDGTWRCLPAQHQLAWESLRADEGCVEGAASSLYTHACVFDRALRANPATAACEDSFGVFEVGAELAAAWSASTSGCTPRTPSPGERYYALGAEVAPASFLAAALLPVTGRVYNLEVEFPEGWRYRDSKLRDALLGGVWSWAVRATDGVERWLPAVAAYKGSLGTYYADSACVEPLAVAMIDGDCVPAHVLETIEGTCPTRWRVYEIGAAHTGSFWQDWGGGCTMAPFSTAGLYRVGAEIDPTQLAPVVHTYR